MRLGNPNTVVGRTQYRLWRWWKRLTDIFKSVPVTKIDAKKIAASDRVSEPGKFIEDDFGDGAFGKWIVDEGLPAYHYTMNQFEDNRATYPVSHGAFRRDHWHQIGNDHLNALASNDGIVQVFAGEGGFMYLNHFDYGAAVSPPGVLWEILKILGSALFRKLQSFGTPYVEPGLMDRLGKAVEALGAHKSYDQQYAYSGGFAYLDDGEDVWSTAYRYSPKLRDKMDRLFGLGYYKTEVEHKKIKVTRRIYAPYGDVPALLVDVDLEYSGSETKTFDYYEYWDINFHQIQFQAFRAGFFGAVGDKDRRWINTLFTPCITWIEKSRALRFHHEPPAPPESTDASVPSEINWHPRDVFLADLSGGEPPQWYFDKAKFFGKGGAEKPDGVGQPAETDTSRISGIIMPYCMVLRRKVTLEPGKPVHLRFAYGTVKPEPSFNCTKPVPSVEMPPDWTEMFQGKYGLDNTGTHPLQETLKCWRQHLAYFSAADATYLQREMAWHAYSLQSSAFWYDYFGIRVVPQGSIYLYVQGIDGVPRDFALFSIPLIYLNPGLARDVLKCIMQMTRYPDGQIAYGYTGNGSLNGALIHNTPSDLDIFFLLALTEYIAATGHVDFLSEPVSFYRDDDQPQNLTVLDHVRVAFTHLTKTIGIGPSKLFRVLDGDWSDDVVVKNTFPIAFFSFRSFPLTVASGESMPNSQMALYVLPRIAALLMSVNSPAARELGEFMKEEFLTLEQDLLNGIKCLWKGSFFARATLRTFANTAFVLHDRQADLEAQVWALISGRGVDVELLNTLRNSVYERCDRPSPIGPLMTSGDVWPAIAQLMTWGYIEGSSDLNQALQSFLNQTFANKAEVYGDSWMNIWSGPDGINGPKMADPGGTYSTFPVTPTTDFPVMNNNQHAMMLMALLRICGIEPAPAGSGLRIKPGALKRYALKLPLLKLDMSPERVKGEYCAHNEGDQTLYVLLPSGPKSVKAIVNGQPVDSQPDSEGYVRLPLPHFSTGESIEFEVEALTKN